MATNPGSSRPSSHGDVDLPVASGDLRDSFDPGLLLGEATGSGGSSRRSANADVEALFADDPAPRRRPSEAEARRQTRRCPSCGGVVPGGMSLCQTCGLDLDTGRREVVDELFDDEPAPTSVAPGQPIGIALVGVAALLASGMLCILALVNLQGLGAIALAIVALFAVLASVQFLRGKSAKPLLAALVIGAGIDVVGLILMPAFEADRRVAEQTEVVAGSSDDDDVRIKPIDEEIDFRRITLGIAILGIDALALIYLSTGGVRRHFEAPRPGSALYLP